MKFSFTKPIVCSFLIGLLSLTAAGDDAVARIPGGKSGPLECFISSNHAGEVSTLQISGDGKLLLTSAWGDKSAKLWQFETWRLLRTFAGHSRAVTAAALSADQKLVVTGSYDGEAHLWDAATGEKLRTIRGQYRARAFAFSADGRYLWTIFQNDNKVRQWEVATGTEVRSFGGKEGVRDLVLSADGKFLYTAGGSSVKRWDVASGAEVQSWGTMVNPGCLAINLDQSKLAVGCGDELAILWDLSAGRRVRNFFGHHNAVTAVAWDDAGSVLLTIPGSGFISFRDQPQLWEVKSGKPLRTFETDNESATSGRLSRDGKQVLLGYSTGRIAAFDAQSGQKQFQVPGDESAVCRLGALTIGPGDRLIVKADDNLVAWDLAASESPKIYPGIKENFQWSTSRDGKRLSLASKATRRHWNLETGKLTAENNRPSDIIKLGLRDAPEQMVVMRSGGGVEIVATASEEVITSLLPPLEEGDERRWHRCVTNDYAVITREKRQAEVWSAASGELLSIVPFSEPVTAEALNPAGDQLVLGDYGGRVRLVDPRGGAVQQTFGPLPTYITAAAISSDGRYVAGGSFDGSISVWDAARGEKLDSLAGLTSDVCGIAFSQDGDWILSTSLDGSLRIWKRDGGVLCLSVYFVAGGQDWLAVTPDGFFDGTPAGLTHLRLRRPQTNCEVSLETVREQRQIPNLVRQVWLRRPLKPLGAK